MQSYTETFEISPEEQAQSEKVQDSIPTQSFQDRHQSNRCTDSQPSCSREEVPQQITSSNPSVDSDYSKEQYKAVRRVFRCQNYYEILDVTLDATSEEIKEAYKKLAIIIHPDKNKAPGANEAFQALGSAKDVLSDPTNRNEYDRAQRLKHMQQNMSNVNMPDVANFDIPTWAVVGGIAIFAAGLFGMLWSASKNGEEESEDE